MPWISKSIQKDLHSDQNIETNVEKWLIQLQNAEILRNKHRIIEFFNDREEKRREKERLQREKEERIRKRKEEKARLAEIKRREALKSLIFYL